MPEIKRIEPGRRFSEAVVCDGVVYISGQVDLARNRDPKVQPKLEQFLYSNRPSNRTSLLYNKRGVPII